MRYFANEYDINTITVDEINSKIENVIESFVHWVATLDRRRSRSDDGTLYVGDMGIIFLVLSVPKLFNNQKCIVRVSRVIIFVTLNCTISPTSSY